jgi:hypothetical protein
LLFSKLFWSNDGSIKPEGWVNNETSDPLYFSNHHLSFNSAGVPIDDFFNWFKFARSFTIQYIPLVLLVIHYFQPYPDSGFMLPDCEPPDNAALGGNSTRIHRLFSNLDLLFTLHFPMDSKRFVHRFIFTHPARTYCCNHGQTQHQKSVLRLILKPRNN